MIMNHRKENAVLKDTVCPCLSIYNNMYLVNLIHCILKTFFHAAFRGMQTYNFGGYCDKEKTIAFVGHSVVFNREIV